MSQEKICGAERLRVRFRSSTVNMAITRWDRQVKSPLAAWDDDEDDDDDDDNDDDKGDDDDNNR